jgi:hypothetical protein
MKVDRAVGIARVCRRDCGEPIHDDDFTLASSDVEIWGSKTLRRIRGGERRAEQLLIRIQHTFERPT